MLYIVATPIGNLADITLRAIETLKDVDYILAEDTRKAGFLLSRMEIKKKLVSFYEHNEKRKTVNIIADLKNGLNIALISSAGTPTISDPGYVLVRECRKEEIEVTALPGPSSIVNALSLTSLPHEKFTFLGYMPRKKSARLKLFEEIKNQTITFVFLESPYRVVKSLANIIQIMGNPQVCLAREMTKKFEEVIEGRVSEVIKIVEKRTLKGEFVLILSAR